VNGVLCSSRNFLSYFFIRPFGSTSPLHHRCDTVTSDLSCHGVYRVSCTLFPWPVPFTEENFAFFTFLSAVSELGCVHVTFAFFILLVSDYFTSSWLTARLSHDWFRLVVLLILSPSSFPAFAFVPLLLPVPSSLIWQFVHPNIVRFIFRPIVFFFFFFFSFHHNILSPVRGTLSTTNSNRHLVFVFFSPSFSSSHPVPLRRSGSICIQFLNFYHPLLTQFPHSFSFVFVLFNYSLSLPVVFRPIVYRPFIHYFRSFVHSFIRSFVHSFIRLFHPLVHFIHPLIH
jgi:hypothetical protein